MKIFILGTIMGLFTSTLAMENMPLPAIEELQAVLSKNNSSSSYSDNSLSNLENGQFPIRDKIIHFYKNELKNNHDSPRVLVEGLVKSGQKPS